MRQRLLFIIAILIVLALPSLGRAATITVNSTSDTLSSGDGACTLREAIINANGDAATYADCTAGSGDDTISIPAGTYCLSIPNSDADSATPNSGTVEEY